jgi:hypothetical protein
MSYFQNLFDRSGAKQRERPGRDRGYNHTVSINHIGVGSMHDIGVTGLICCLFSVNAEAIANCIDLLW